MDGLGPEVVLVAACLRGGEGGSPTAVVPNGAGLRDADLARIPERAGTSHVAVIDPGDVGVGGAGDEAGERAALRFFTSAGELPGCGHGTVAALAVLAMKAGRPGYEGVLRVAGQNLGASGRVEPGPGPGSRPDGTEIVEAWFDQGLVDLRPATVDERAAFLAALGLAPDALHPDDEIAVASPGRPRLLIPVADRAVLAGIRPDHEKLFAASHRFGQLGCFVYVPPSTAEPGTIAQPAGHAGPADLAGRAAARMFAPAIGVPEDIANANSTGCLAAHLLNTGRPPTVAVDQGDALGAPSTVHATADRTDAGIATRVGGTARLLPRRG